jgi:hypothetical protein
MAEETAIYVDSVRRFKSLMKDNKIMKPDQQETSQEPTVLEVGSTTSDRSHNLVTWTNDADLENPR